MKNILRCAFALVLLVACQNQASDSVEKIQTIPEVAQDVVYRDSMTNQIYQSYQNLKNALVSDQYEDAKIQAEALEKALIAKTGCETTAVLVTQMKASADIKSMRTAFVAVNVELVPFLKHQTLVSGNLYEQYCPMANGGEGANWVSNSNTVRNPYYGAEMLDCGNVVDSVKIK